MILRWQQFNWELEAYCILLGPMQYALVFSWPDFPSSVLQYTSSRSRNKHVYMVVRMIIVDNKHVYMVILMIIVDNSHA